MPETTPAQRDELKRLAETSVARGVDSSLLLALLRDLEAAEQELDAWHRDSGEWERLYDKKNKLALQLEAERNACQEAVARYQYAADAALARVERLEALLHRLEWCRGERRNVCPACLSNKPGSMAHERYEGHAADCYLAAALKGG